MLILQAPAKLNLTLEVLGERQDGFHEIRSVIQAINLCDRLCFQPSQSIEFNCANSSWIPANSLISKAVCLLQKATGCAKGVAIEIKRRIPLISGLSGDSSGAAAALCGLNRFWKLGLSLTELLELASQLGSDVSFFLYGGTALVKGRGEMVTPLPPSPHIWVVLMVPPVPRVVGKTERLYANLKASHYTDGQITDRLATMLTEGREITSSCLFNVFDSVALDSFDGLKQHREQFLQAGAEEVHLAGSGPTLFTLTNDSAKAEKIYLKLQKQGLESYLTDTPVAVGK